MSLERARASLARLRALTEAPAPPPRALALPTETALELFESQLYCRLTDIEAHELRARGEGFYTIASAGHEGNAALGRLTRTSDPALLHYRSGAFFFERARQAAGVDPVRDLLLSLTASADDPISGGRHKVLGSVPLGIPPQTSTIASHLPRAVGMAVSLGVAARLHVGEPRPSDSIVVCSFGDASLNHSTAQGALNSAAWTAYQRLPMPLLFVCEDNGLGISVRTPASWVETSLRRFHGFGYFAADGWNLAETFEATQQAVHACRARRAPVVLHLRCRRLWGHAGSDVDTEYRSTGEIARAEEDDPVLRAALDLLSAGTLDPRALGERLDRALSRVRAASDDAVKRPRLTTRLAVMAPLAPARPALVAAEARRGGYGNPPEQAEKPRTLGLSIRAGLYDLMTKYRELLVFGEDVAQKGGVYGVTGGLHKAFGPGRVWNTLLDEQAILGMALGAGSLGLLPFPEIQFLAYLHNAEDQLRGEAATLSFFSNAQLKNPMVVRIAGLGYQKGFGGHFHNDDSLAVLRDLPGVWVAVPSRGDDAVKLLRTLAAAAKVDGRVSAFVEPIALYQTRDLYAEGDGQWTFPFPAQGEALDPGEVGVYGPEDGQLAILTYGNGVPMSLRVRRRLAAEGIAARVIDIRWLAPLPEAALYAHARETGRVLVVDECRRSGNVSEGIAACLLDDPATARVRFARVAAADSFVPLGDAARLVLPSEDEILSAARALARD